MTAFDKTKFSYFGKVLTYDGKFVARFKHVASNKPGFQAFLVKHFTVEEYFAALDTVNPENSLGNKYAPGEVLEAKGYIPAHIRKWLLNGTIDRYRNHTAASIAA